MLLITLYQANDLQGFMVTSPSFMLISPSILTGDLGSQRKGGLFRPPVFKHKYLTRFLLTVP